jgi:hypothetical protein
MSGSAGFSKILSGLVLAARLLAQDQGAAPAASREDVISSEQAEKAKTSRPPHPNKVEAAVLKVESWYFTNRSGWYPYFGSVYQGGGLTGGALYRRYYGDNTFWTADGLYSIKNYKLIEGTTVSQGHWNGKLSFGGRLGWRDATQVGFYGLGQQSEKADRANFRFQQTYLDGTVNLRPRPWLFFIGGSGFEHWNTLSGQGSDPSIETKYTPVTAPGLGADPSYIHSVAAAGIDWRQSPGYTRRGGLYGVTFHDYHNTNGGLYNFQRLDAEVVQHVPLLRETWVLAARGRVQTTLNDNDVIPYFLLPSLGGGSTLRGYDSDRFRDRHSLLMNAEFRWIPMSALDMALFYDAGKVASRRSDLDFNGLKSDVGIGARFHGFFSTPLRIDLAVSNEGWHVVFSGGPMF